ncbi:MAG: hypothetical protein ABSC48_07955 [Terracidiphilus sp.]|jgi:hypothetical protein
MAERTADIMMETSHRGDRWAPLCGANLFSGTETRGSAAAAICKDLTSGSQAPSSNRVSIGGKAAVGKAANRIFLFYVYPTANLIVNWISMPGWKEAACPTAVNDSLRMGRIQLLRPFAGALTGK